MLAMDSGLLKSPIVFSSIFLCLLLPQAALAVKANVKTVPWVATDRLIPHDTYSGKQITLKGTADVQGNSFKWTWDFGDGTGTATGTVTNSYVIEATHQYNGSPGQAFTATLSVQDTTNGDVGTNTYIVQIHPKAIRVELDIAVDEALWYLHKTQNRTTSGVTAVGDWLSGGFASSGFYGVSAENVNAFEVWGHLESGDPNDPYTETVQRGMRSLFGWLTTKATSPQTNALGTFNPDTNGNGYSASVSQAYPYYQGGMFIDAIIASRTADAVAPTGPPAIGADPGIKGRKYRDIVADLVDGYLACQHTGAAGGGWRYQCGEAPDNSACQWAAIGLIPAERALGIAIPPIVKNWNKVWLKTSQDASTGRFGYADMTNSPWGPFADTPSGMVQMAMDGIGRGDPRWDTAESFMRDNFGNPPSAGAAAAPRAYYYGLFSLVKSLLLHDPKGNGIPQPIDMLRSSTKGVLPIDWFYAQASAGDPSDGVARTLVNDQSAAGYWTAHDPNTDQFPFETAFAIVMLNQSIVNPRPVGVISASPNPVDSGGTVTFDGSGSFHQDPFHKIVKWEWDFGPTCATPFTPTATGPQVTRVFNLPVGSYCVRLRVTDDSVPALTDTASINVAVANPPIPPTANAGGPYSFCPQGKPWILDGTKSTNPDNGLHDAGAPGDFITSYQWDLSGKNTFTDATGPKPDVTALFSSRVGTSFLISLKVTDNTALSFPASGQPNLTSIDTAQVFVRQATDPACSQCPSDVKAAAIAATPPYIEVTWTGTGADRYNVYRSETSDGPYAKIGTGQMSTKTGFLYIDSAVFGGHTYYYVIRPAGVDGVEICQSNPSPARVPGQSVSAQACGNLTITNYQFISQQAAAGVQAFLTYTADVVNPGGALGSVRASARTTDPFTLRLAPGQEVLNFSPVPANSTVTSNNTLTIIMDPKLDFDGSKLEWMCESTPAPPVAKPGPDQTVKVGSTVTLDGNGSLNPSGIGTLTYSWVLTSRPPGTIGSRLLYSATPTTSFIPDAPGVYVVTLTVSNGVASGSASVTVTATP